MLSTSLPCSLLDEASIGGVPVRIRGGLGCRLPFVRLVALLVLPFGWWCRSMLGCLMGFDRSGVVVFCRTLVGSLGVGSSYDRGVAFLLSIASSF